MTQDLPTIIAFTGRAGSGKTTAMNWVLRSSRGTARISFAGPLKAMVSALIKETVPRGHDRTAAEYLGDPVLKNAPLPFLGNFSARHLMQTLGTEWGRKAVHEDFWVAVAAGKLERAMGMPQRKVAPVQVVIDDVRFQNEADMVRAYGGVVVRIVRPGPDTTVGIAGHASEDLDFDADATILNDGTIGDLEAKLADMFPIPAKDA